eukprot:comp12483_c0_seq1/m.7431 comp12483_c0_seq1/g.7431  ORF comp12483_c0_seq1/g.7431 comp12483_c0_seq1/m.7431 type:complete len:147 (-) comp12483_c0_seq1:163-603(-)
MAVSAANAALSILLAALAKYIFTTLWFTVMFGEMFLGLISEERGTRDWPKPDMFKGMVLELITTLGETFVLSFLSPDSYFEAFNFAFVLWLAFTVPTLLSSTLWESRPLKLFVLQSPSRLLATTVTVSVLLACRNLDLAGYLSIGE